MKKPVLAADERELATYRANRSRRFGTRGGHLLLTDQRVVFYPHALDSSTGGKSWECALASISGVCMSARGFNPFDGSLRRRLQIEVDGATEYFVVDNGDAIVTRSSKRPGADRALSAARR